ncbi:hypothetical protein QR680_018705 [Steinernema hermaphroditum]|uniref:Uncharacterized protein n=1 Tax=Steinernema hermaphroditum TaxID=289476 RepID=A0AA39HK28_9BILA|nr:hypothetical protein QR680_018705 [Steinernema hermaphroditum]
MFDDAPPPPKGCQRHALSTTRQTDRPPRMDSKQLIVTAELEPVPDISGMYINKYLSLVIDRRGVFSTLVPAVQIGERKAEVVFKGFAPNRVAHFEVLCAHEDLTSQHERQRIIEGKGYTIGEEIVCPTYSTTFISIDWPQKYPIGTPVQFQAALDESNGHPHAYITTFVEPIANADSYNLQEAEVGEQKALACSVYRQQTARAGTFWMSPLLGVVDDINGVLNRVSSSKRGCRVVVSRDADFKKATTLFYVLSLEPNSTVEKLSVAVGRVEEMLA